MQSHIAIVDTDDLQAFPTPQSALELTPKALGRCYRHTPSDSETVSSVDSDTSSEPSSAVSTPYASTSALIPDLEVNAPLPKDLFDVVEEPARPPRTDPRLYSAIHEKALAAREAHQKQLMEMLKKLKDEVASELNPYAATFIPTDAPSTPVSSEPLVAATTSRRNSVQATDAEAKALFPDLVQGVTLPAGSNASTVLARRLVNGHQWTESLMRDLVNHICFLAFSMDAPCAASFSAILRDQFYQLQGSDASQSFSLLLSQCAIAAFRGFWDMTYPSAIRPENPWSATVLPRAFPFSSFIGDLYAQDILSTDNALECVRLLSCFSAIEHVKALHLLVSHAGHSLWFAHPIEHHRRLPARIGNQVIDGFVRDINEKARMMEDHVIGFTRQPRNGELQRLTDAVVDLLLGWKLAA
ncbi:hypothetical protein HGRIS_009582 [Hohenbuehelia grisea]|uniref:Uncharacterized protein n=1 Tax=Hohenbuehelia grisea TaxID=104357 RepID=A0ABR3J208_9AGAR